METEEETIVEEESLPSEADGWSGSDAIASEPEDESEPAEAEEEEADAESEADEGESQEQPEPDESEAQEEKPKSTAGIPLPRFKQVYRERAEYKERYEKLQLELQQKAGPVKSGPPKRPALTYNEEEDQRNLDAYEKEREEYIVSQAIERIKRENTEAEERRRQEQEQERINKALDEDPEYANLVREVLEEGDAFFEQITPELGQAIREQGTAFEKYILKNRNEVLPKLTSLSGVKLGMEIGKLSSSLQKPTAQKLVKVKESKAPPPITKSRPAKKAISIDIPGWV